MGYLEAIAPEDGRRRFRLLDPRNRSEVGTFRVNNAEDVAAAVARARQAQSAWGDRSPADRASTVLRAVDVLLARRQHFLDVMTRETGRVELDTLMIELLAALDSLNYFSRNAAKVLGDRRIGLHLLRHKRAKLTYRPLGVVGVISPWNGPFILSLNPAVQALLAGNAVLVKPSEVTPMSGLLVQELFDEAGLPPGLLQVLTGDGETGAALIEAGVDKITFTGSVATGRKVGEACGRNLIPCTLELGGKDPMVVFDDADLDRAAGGAVFGGVFNNGQFCSSTERIYVHEPVYDAFVDKVVRIVEQIAYDRDIGPFIFEPQCDRVQQHVDDAVAAGARVVAGGTRKDGYYAATVLVDVDHTMAVMRDETFGPILPIMRFRTADEAVALANDSEYGLGASVWTRDTDFGERIAKRLVAGAVTINEASVTYGALEVPFGGRKSSGVGRTNGADALRNYAHAMPILTDRLGLTEERVWFPYLPHKVEEIRRALPLIWGSPLKYFLK
jgi:succinate-semialdehyde dehydrogenase/glutarate-semialdehyde dehydrogenase